MLVEFSDNFLSELPKLNADIPKLGNKVMELVLEISNLPKNSLEGTGRPERLVGKLTGQFSRRITQKHRLVYHYHQKERVVIFFSCYGHYGDK